MLTNEVINNLIGVSESFHAPYKLTETLSDKNSRINLFESFLFYESNLNYDWFTDYFQAEHSDRKSKKQDFTPDGIVKIANSVLGHFESNTDICAGTGGLTIKRWTENKDAIFYCEEFSDRAVPFLLFNLSIRNMEAYVFHGDALERDFKNIYQLTKGEKFSEITIIQTQFSPKSDTVIMNPPYSMVWNQSQEVLYGAIAPKSKADYAFLIQGLNSLKDNGTMSIILPRGVLFRGNAEATIRKSILEHNLLDAVIGLPAKTFLNTDIPTVVLVLKKNRSRDKVLFIDASQEFTKGKTYNFIEDKHSDKVLNIYQNRLEVEKFSREVSMREIEENQYNLNIPRYIDTFEAEPPISLSEITADMKNIDKEIAENQKTISENLSVLVGTNEESDKEIKEFAEYFKRRIAND